MIKRLLFKQSFGWIYLFIISSTLLGAAGIFSSLQVSQLLTQVERVDSAVETVDSVSRSLHSSDSEDLYESVTSASLHLETLLQLDAITPLPPETKQSISQALAILEDWSRKNQQNVLSFHNTSSDHSPSQKMELESLSELRKKVKNSLQLSIQKARSGASWTFYSALLLYLGGFLCLVTRFFRTSSKKNSPSTHSFHSKAPSSPSYRPITLQFSTPQNISSKQVPTPSYSPHHPSLRTAHLEREMSKKVERIRKAFHSFSLQLEQVIQTLSHHFSNYRKISHLEKLSKEKTQQSQSLHLQMHIALTSIQDVVACIDEISGKTKLLALNATIEASATKETIHRSFAVIADEIKDLANQMTQATLALSKQVERVERSSSSFLRSLEDCQKEIRSYTEFTQASFEKLNEIRLQPQSLRRVLHELQASLKELKDLDDEE